MPRVISFFLSAIALTVASAASVAAQSLTGIVVDDTPEALVLKAAGLKSGDVILSWGRLPSLPNDPFGGFGVLRSPLDWIQLANEQLPRGPIDVAVEGAPRTIRLSIESLSTSSVTKAIRPRLSEDLLKLYSSGRTDIAARHLESGIAYWQQLLVAARTKADPDLVCWTSLKISEAFSSAGQNPKATIALLGLTSPTSTIQCKTEAYEALGDIYYLMRNLKASENAYQQASLIREATFGKTLGWAKIETLLGKIAWERRSLDLVETHWKEGLQIQKLLAPFSTPTATSLANLGSLYSFRGKQDIAEQYSRDALAMMEKLSPNSIPVARILTTLGNINLLRGNLDLAESYMERSLRIKRNLAPKDPQLAASLNNLGALAFSRGDLEAASGYYKEAIEIWRVSDANGMELAMGMSNLGNALLYRGELDLARAYYEDSLSIRLRLAPESLDTAAAFNNLGSVFQFQGKTELADQYYRKALEIQERIAPRSLNVARSLANLENLASRKGNLSLAKELITQALSIRLDLAPTSAETADFLTDLGLISRLAGDNQQAIKNLERAQDIMNELSLESEEAGRVHYELGKAYLQSDPIKAAEQFEQAIGIIEHQTAKHAELQDIRAAFATQHQGLYRDYYELLIQQHRYEEAFLVLERYRTKHLLTLLAERDLVSADDVPRELNDERKSIEAKYNNLQQKIATASRAQSPQDLSKLTIEMRKARVERAAIVSKIKSTSPKYASLHYPQSLSFSATRECLDNGTLLLTYGVGDRLTYLFVVSPDEPLSILKIDVGESELRARIEELRLLNREYQSRSRIAHEQSKILMQRSANIYGLLIAPAEAMIARHKRVLIIPDGPLNVLPWGMLVREEKKSPATRAQYFAEWKSFHIVASATLYKELKYRHNATGRQGLSLVAFGDPHFPQRLETNGASSAGEMHVRAMVERGFNFAPLPASGIEAEKIGHIYNNNSRVFLGLDASEENAKSIPRDTRIVHFATHATLDERFPLNSAVVLSIPEKFEEGKENGLLQAWEIFEQVRLDADLVVLSACESGLGKEMGGEGLIGLTRAFQYAGARSVMASLWKISDRTTAELMVRFYKHLKEGLPKDEALRAVQMEFVHGPIQVKNEKGEVEEIDASAPYYWAAFQIYGDWQ